MAVRIRKQKASPKKMPADLRSSFVKVGFTRLELKSVQQAAKREGLSLAAWLRTVTLKAAVAHKEKP